MIPVVIWSNGCVSESLSKYLGNISLRHEIKELQKTAILSTAHTYFGKYWHQNTKRLSREIKLHVPQNVTTEQLQHYISWNMVCFRHANVNVNSLYKSDLKNPTTTKTTTFFSILSTLFIFLFPCSWFFIPLCYAEVKSRRISLYR